MVDQNSQEPGATIDSLRLGIRKITHELSSPLGVLRMTAHYLRTQEMSQDKRQHYLKVLNESVDRLEDGLHRMRALADPDYRPQTQSVPPNDPLQ
jgi:nitrogen-specific signal transduction histidine kinase